MKIEQKPYSKLPAWYALPILMGLFQSTLFAATPQFIANTGLSTIQWSLLLSMPTLLFLVLSPQWGKWADRRGASYIIRYAVLGLACSIVSLAAVWLVGDSLGFVPWVWFFAIAITRILYGMSASGVMPLCQSLAIEVGESENRKQRALHSELLNSKNDDSSLKRLGFVSASLSIGRLCGPLLLLVLMTQISWILVVFSFAGLVVAFLVTRFSVRNEKALKMALEKDNLRGESSTEAKDPNEPSHISKSMWVYFGLAFGVTFYVGYLQFVLGPLFLDWMDSAGEATVMLSVTMSIVAVVALLCQVFVVKHLNWRSPVVMVILALVLMITSAGLSVIDSPHHIFWFLVPMALSIALLTPIYSRRAMAVSQQAKGQISGRLAVAHTAGYPIGSLLAGMSYGLAPEWWWLPLSVIAVGLFIAVVAMMLAGIRAPVATN